MADNRGRDAVSPWHMPLRGWIDVLKRSWREMRDDNLSLIGAGVAFYAFLSIVPLLGAMVLSYGLIADPEAVVHEFRRLSTMLPQDAAKLISDQLMNVVHTEAGKKGLGLAIALLLALWGATKATGAIVTALNIAYEEEETRGFVKRTILNLGMVIGALLAVGLAMAAIAVFAHLEDFLPQAPEPVLVLGRIVSWIVLAGLGAGGAATLYRFGPDRDVARWIWLTPGSIFSAVAWGLLTAGFGIYVANFAHYGATYGSLSAVIVLLTWLYLSALIFLLGAEVNSELEHQTARDTTAGPERPLGQRGAQMADRVAPDEDGDTVATMPAPSRTAAPRAKTALPYGLAVWEALLILMLALVGRRSRATPAE